MYIWQRTGWPRFRWDASAVQGMVTRYAMEAGTHKGGLAQAGMADELMVDLMVSEAVNTSAIEGEFLARQEVRSSILNRLGLGDGAERDPRSRGIASLLVAVRERLGDKLTVERLCECHDMLFSDPEQRARIVVGRWRENEVRVVSGPMGIEVVHPELSTISVTRSLPQRRTSPTRSQPSSLKSSARSSISSEAWTGFVMSSSAYPVCCAIVPTGNV